jgi:hypothetical protein
MCAITKKVRHYEVGRDDRGLNISTFTYGVGSIHVRSMQYTKVDLASLACVDMVSGTRRPKGRAWVTWMM